MALTETVKKNLEQARATRGAGNYKGAKVYYDEVLKEDPANCEARYYDAYFALYDSDPADWPKGFTELCEQMRPLITELSQTDLTDQEKYDQLYNIHLTFYGLARKCNDKINQNANGQNTFSVAQPCGLEGIMTMYDVGNCMMEHFPVEKEEFRKMFLAYWKEGIQLQKDWPLFKADKELPEAYAKMIRGFEPSYVIPKGHLGCKFH